MTVIGGPGTPESIWGPWLAATAWPDATPSGPGTPSGADTACGPGPVHATGPRRRAVVLAAHPDDEVLGAGGLLHLLARAGWRVDVLWASDGEASHPGSTVLPPDELARRRRSEATEARRELGLDGTTRWLALPDSGLQPHESAVVDALDSLVGPTGSQDPIDPQDPTALADLLVAPWHADGHPDHEVCGRAALRVGAARGVPVHEVPIWAWHWGTPADVGPRWSHLRTVRLDPRARAAKAAAVQRFVSQVRPLGPAAEDRAVLPADVLARFARPVEVVLCTPAGQP